MVLRLCYLVPVEIAGPITVEELTEAHVLSVPRLLRGSVRRRSQQSLNPSKWRLGMVALIGMVFLAQILFDPSIGSEPKWGLLLLLVLVVGYRVFFSSQTMRKGYERRIERIPRVLSVDTDGVRLEDRAKVFQFHPWSAYQSWREGSNVFVLRGPQRLSNIVPKRGLTPQQVDELRVLLAMHMPDCA
ncbi:MAG TPA: YcxB family protein [Acidobacteriaceae bacterium]|nr:YcxB family protein [Acidobacteriaceae bacterium]